MAYHPPVEPTGLTVQEAAARLGVGVATVWRWIRAGRLRTEHIGPRGSGVTRVPEDALADAPTPQPRGRRSGR